MPTKITPPGRALLLLEGGRAFIELAACLPAYPFLRRAPRGDGHPVLVFPGLMASDFSTRTLRAFLRDRGYHVHGWRLGMNLGPSPHCIDGLRGRLEEVHERHARRVTLIGWSLGGIYARELARRFPEQVRQVITLATPFRDLDATNVPRFLRHVTGRPETADDGAVRARLREPLPVPSTAIYSQSDAIAAWQSCVEDTGPTSESIEVASSHCGIGHHPAALLAIADRLAQPEGTWTPYRSANGWRWPLGSRVA